MPIFVGGMVRWLADQMRGVSASEAETETSPGVLLSSGYIAGGTLCGLVIAFFTFLPTASTDALMWSHNRFLYRTKRRGSEGENRESGNQGPERFRSGQG